MLSECKVRIATVERRGYVSVLLNRLPEYKKILVAAPELHSFMQRALLLGLEFARASAGEHHTHDGIRRIKLRVMRMVCDDNEAWRLIEKALRRRSNQTLRITRGPK